MPFLLDCQCGKKRVTIPDQHLGKRLRCPACGNELSGTPRSAENGPAPQANTNQADILEMRPLKRYKLLVEAFRNLGESAETLGWGGDALKQLTEKRKERFEAKEALDKAIADAALAKGTPGAPVANRVFTAVKARFSLVDGVLTGLLEHLGRAALSVTCPPKTSPGRMLVLDRFQEELEWAGNA